MQYNIQDFLNRNPQYQQQNGQIYYQGQPVNQQPVNQQQGYQQQGYQQQGYQPVQNYQQQGNQRYGHGGQNHQCRDGNCQRREVQNTSNRENVRDWKTFPVGKKVAYIVVYADWCGHCKTMKQRLGDKIRGNQTVMFLEEKVVPHDLAVEGYPTVLKFVNGKRVNNANVDEVVRVLQN